MRESEPPGVQHLPREAGAFPVNSITQQWMPKMLQMNANLVSAARMKGALDERPFPHQLKHSPRRARLTPAATLHDRHLLAVYRMPADGRGDLAEKRCRVPRDERQVDLCYLTACELVR